MIEEQWALNGLAKTAWSRTVNDRAVTLNMNPIYAFDDPLSSPVSVAPMMDHTDRHFRYFLRKISRKAVLYTEMIGTSSILNGDKDKILQFDQSEHPVVLQLAGNNPDQMAECARIGSQFGYDAINLNIGCPSDRVSSGSLGAKMMSEPELVRDCVAAIRERLDLPVSVKHRIGIDDQDSYEFMKNFIEIVSQSGCNHFIIHARVALLNGISPRANRQIPPLRYEEVYKIKEQLPELFIELNGGVKTITDINLHLARVDSVMIGREAYENPYLFSMMDGIVQKQSNSLATRREIALSMIDYIEKIRENSIRIHHVTRHILNLMKFCPGSRHWRTILSNTKDWNGSIESLLKLAMKKIPDQYLDTPGLAIGDAALQASSA